MKKTVYTNPYFSVVKEGSYHYIDYGRPHSGVVILLIMNKQILLVNSYRFPIKQKQWELPRGFIDQKETPIQAALRELEEETGIIAKKKEAKVIGFIAPDSGGMNNTVPVVKIEIKKEQKLQNKDGEVLDFKMIDKENLSKGLKKLKVIDGFTLSAIQLYQMMD